MVSFTSAGIPGAVDTGTFFSSSTGLPALKALDDNWPLTFCSLTISRPLKHVSHRPTLFMHRQITA